MEESCSKFVIGSIIAVVCIESARRFFHAQRSKRSLLRFPEWLKRNRIKGIRADKIQGVLYGYPSCCLEQFLELKWNTEAGREWRQLANEARNVFTIRKGFPLPSSLWPFNEIEYLPCRACAKRILGGGDPLQFKYPRTRIFVEFDHKNEPQINHARKELTVYEFDVVGKYLRSGFVAQYNEHVRRKLAERTEARRTFSQMSESAKDDLRRRSSKENARMG